MTRWSSSSTGRTVSSRQLDTQGQQQESSVKHSIPMDSNQQASAVQSQAELLIGEEGICTGAASTSRDAKSLHDAALSHEHDSSQDSISKVCMSYCNAAPIHAQTTPRQVGESIDALKSRAYVDIRHDLLNQSCSAIVMI